MAESGYTISHYFPALSDLTRYVAKRIRERAVVGWFQGRAEWGPRALGNRSILADPTDPKMRDIVNERIKHRELFRPFAPAVLKESAHEFFDMPNILPIYGAEYFMLAVHPVKPDKRSVIPSVTHADGTGRIQIVTLESNERFYRLIEAFGELSGVPVLINTSFNLRGEPIVNSPHDALLAFSYCDMDLLVLGDYVVEKEI